MVLAVDVGNSFITYGLFDAEGSLQFRSTLPTERYMTKDQIALSLREVFRLYEQDISLATGAILSCVVPSVMDAMVKALTWVTKKPPLVVGPGIKTGLNIKSDTHGQLGADIVACCVAAIAKYPSPIIVIDMGTAVSLSYLNGNIYEGCVIMPGIRVSLEALSNRAAELPHISIEAPTSIFGHNTIDAMRSGVVYGSASMVDGMIGRLEEASAPAASLVATGGGGFATIQACKREILYDRDLLLDGLYLLYQKSTSRPPRSP